MSDAITAAIPILTHVPVGRINASGHFLGRIFQVNVLLRIPQFHREHPALALNERRPELPQKNQLIIKALQLICKAFSVFIHPFKRFFIKHFHGETLLYLHPVLQNSYKRYGTVHTMYQEQEIGRVLSGLHKAIP